MSESVDVTNSATNPSVGVTMHLHNFVIWTVWKGSNMLLGGVDSGHMVNGWCTHSLESDRWFEIDFGGSYLIKDIRIRKSTEGPELAKNLSAFLGQKHARQYWRYNLIC